MISSKLLPSPMLAHCSGWRRRSQGCCQDSDHSPCTCCGRKKK